MRLLVTAADCDGRSFLESETDIARDGTVSLYEAIDWPPTTLAPGDADFYDNSPAPGALVWRMATFPPGLHISAHYTTSIDLDHVVAGSVTLGLDDGDHQLFPGDCVVVRGVGHRWTAGPYGSTMVITRIGTA